MDDLKEIFARIKVSEDIQKRLCSNSRKAASKIPDRMGRRLIKNIDESIKYFKEYGDSVLDIGCGDGLGLEHFIDLGINHAAGIELVQERVDVARSFGLFVRKGIAEDLSEFGEKSYNIFCSHTLEHAMDQLKAINEIKRVADRLVWILVPIEFSGRSGNAAHFSPVKSLSQIGVHFPAEEWTKIIECYRTNLEPEGLIAFVRK